MNARWLRQGLIVAAVIAISTAACTTNPPPPPAGLAPKYPAYPKPDIPAALSVAPDIRALHDVAWQRLQAGDLGGARRDFNAVLRKARDFYPSVTGLGFASLADRDFKAASGRFSSVTAQNDRYLPAWVGKAEAELGAGNDAEAVVALERILTLDPKREGVRGRLDLVKFRQLQALIESGRRAKQAGRLADARRDLDRALALAPNSASIVHELALVEIKAGSLDAAEDYARRVVQFEPADTAGYVTLADVLEARQKYAEAATALTRAGTLDPRPEWRKRAADLRARAYLAAIPEEFRDTPTRPSITRGEVAAYVGIKLGPVLEQAPARPVTVATDVRTHWAAPWILPVTRAGVMTILPNHTFQPTATVRRNELAEIASALIALAAGPRSTDLPKWRAARPRFADVPQTNVFYRSVALAVTAGAMTADADGRFQPTRQATGAELVAAVARLDDLAERAPK